MSKLRAFRFPDDLDRELSVEAERRKITATDAVIEALRLWLERGEAAEAPKPPTQPRLGTIGVRSRMRTRTTVVSPVRALELQVGPTESGPGSRLKKR